MIKIQGVCSVKECGRQLKARGYCQTHYMQIRRGYPITDQIKVRVSEKPEECVEEGCSDPVKAKGLCKAHYQRFLRHGHTKYRDRTKPTKECVIPTCGNVLYSNGLCHAHYAKERTWKSRGLTAKGYIEKLSAQKFVCAICEKEERSTDARSGKVRDLAVDHSHETNEIRGLLCSSCNRGLGLFQDDPELIAKAAGYLLRYAKPHSLEGT